MNISHDQMVQIGALMIFLSSIILVWKNKIDGIMFIIMFIASCSLLTVGHC